MKRRVPAGAVEPVDLTVEGTRVYAEHHRPAKRRARGGVLLLHGLNSDLREFGGLPATLAAAGLHALAFDQRGFGASAGERGRTGLDRVLAETDVASAYLQAQVRRAMPLGLVGHSLGGALVLGVLARRRRYAAAALAHPVRCLFDELNPVERAAYHVLGTLNRKHVAKGRPARTVPYKIRYRDMFVDPAARDEARREPFLQERASLSNYDFAATMEADRWAAQVHVPVLCIQSPFDRVVEPEHSEAVYDALAGPVERFSHLGGHSLFRDRDGAAVAEACAEFFARRLGGARYGKAGRTGRGADGHDARGARDGAAR